MSGKIPHFRPGPPIEQDWEENGVVNRWEEAEKPLQDALAIGSSGRGYADLGEFFLRSNAYKEAIIPLTKALKISPGSPTLRASLKQARQIPHIEAWAKQHNPKKQQVREVVPFPVQGRHLWAVLSSERAGVDWENALISVFEERHNRLSLLWRSSVIASIAHRNYVHADLWAFPMIGRKVPELVFMGVCSGGSANPTRMQIYHWTGRTFRQVLDANSGEQALWIDDLHYTGRYQVRCVDLVGMQMGHGGQIRWVDIYDWNGKRYVEANEKYPGTFRQTKLDILVQLSAHPQDPELLKYLGRAYRQEGRRRLALLYRRRMEHAYITLLKSDPDDIDSWWSLGESAEQTGHRARAAECFGKAQRISRILAKKEVDHDSRHYYLEFAKDASERITALQRPAKP